MARSYSKYEYETSPRKLAPYYAPKKKKTDKDREQQLKNIKKQKAEKKLKFKVMAYLIAFFTVLFAVCYRNAKIDESFDKVQSLKFELAAIEKENAQLEVSIESNLNLINLEQQARTMLGMQKLTNKQTEYVSLPKTDYIEVPTEQVVMESNKGILETVIDFFGNLFK